MIKSKTTSKSETLSQSETLLKKATQLKNDTELKKESPLKKETLLQYETLPKHEVLLSLKQFQFGFGPQKSLCNPFDLNLSSAEIAFVIGPNGAGKSTFLRTVSGLQTAATAESQIILNPQDVAFFPSQWDLDQSLTIADMESLFQKSVVPERLKYLRGRWWGLHAANKKMARLSSGERQKILLGLVLSRKSRIFVLDEPQNFLEPSTSLELQEIFQQLQKAGCLIICASHDLTWCARLQTARCLLLKGRNTLPMSGSLTEVLRSQDFQEVFRVRAQFWHDEENISRVSFEKS